MLAALRAAVASVSSELAEKNAVTRVLAENGHRRAPTVVQQRDASGITRVYLWADAGIALVTGPSLEGTVYEVHAVPAGANPTDFDLFIPGERGRSAFAAGRKAKALANPAPARTPLAQTPRRIAARPVAPPPSRVAPLLHNPPKGPPASIPGPEAFAPAAGDVYGSAMLDKMRGKSASGVNRAVLAAVIRRVVKDIGLADKVSVEKGDTSVYAVEFKPKSGFTFAPDVEPTLKKVMTVGLGGNFGGIGFAAPSAYDPYADYAGPTATVFKAPYANYVEALLYGALVANDIPTLPDYAPPTPTKASAASGTAKAGAGKVYITFKPGVGLTVSGDTYTVKDIIKDAGFFWTGKPSANGLGKYGYPPNVWAAAKSDSASSTSSLVGWEGKKDTVTDTVTKLSNALLVAGADVLVTGIVGASTPIAAPAAAPVAPKSADPNPPPPSPVTSIAVPFGAPLEPLQPNPVWAEGGGVDAIASRLVYHAPKPGGGLSGEVLRDPQTGKLFLAKYPPDKGMVASEVLAAHLYRAFGALAPDMRPATVKGKHAILSPWIDGLKPVASSASSWDAKVPSLEKKYLAATFPLDVWLADYDVVGLTYDNMLWVPPDPHIIRVDPGASLFFRASGALKHPLPTTEAAPDLDSMLFKPKNDKTPVVFAAAKDDPSLMLPVANALAGTPSADIDALAKWAGYAMSTGLTFPTLSIGEFLHDRAKTLRDAVMAKAGVSDTPVFIGTPAVATATFDREKLAKAVAEVVGGTYALAGGVLPTIYLPATGGAQWHVGFYHASQGFAQAKVMKYDGVTNESFGIVSMAVPSPFTSAFYFKAFPYFADEIKKIVNANTAPAPTPAATPAAPASAPVFTTGAGPLGANATSGMLESIAEKIAALLPGTSANGLLLSWDVTNAANTVGVKLTAPGANLVAIITVDGEPKQKLEYLIPSGSLASFKVSRAADIANAMKPYLAFAAVPKASVPASATPVGMEEVSLTEVDALPNGSIVTGEGATTLYVRDSSDLWRELTPDGDFMPGLFSDDVYDILGPPVFLVYEGEGAGPDADDAIMLSAYYSTAMQKFDIKKKGAVATLLAPSAPAAPKPAAAPAAPAKGGDPESWPHAVGQLVGAMAPDNVWAEVGGATALAKRLANAVKGQQLGSFPGGKMTDPQTKREFYVKFFKNAEHAETEALASHFYRALGINAPDVRVVPAGLLGGHGPVSSKAALISPWQGKAYKQIPNGEFTPDEKVELAKQFPADVWMANYDVVGKGPATKYDNLLVSELFSVKMPEHFLRVDQGAALDYRSTGSVKKSAKDWSVNAAQTWGDFLSSQHPTLFKVFGSATPTTGAEMIGRIAALINSAFFVLAVARASRLDLSETLKGRAGWLAGMLAAETPKAAAPVPAPAAPAPAATTGLISAALIPLPTGGKIAFSKGAKFLATDLNKALLGHPLLVADKVIDSVFLKFPGDPIWQQFKSGYSQTVPTPSLPANSYTMVAYGDALNAMSPNEWLALAFPSEAAAPPKGPGTVEQIKALSAQVRQLVVSKGFVTKDGVGLEFIVTLYEGTEPNGFSVVFMRSEASGKVTVKFHGSDLGLYTLGKPMVAETIANAVLAQLRSKMAQFNLTKQSAGAAPAAGPVTVGSILTTVEQVKALPVGSVIAYGTSVGTKGSVALFRCVNPDEWMLTKFSGELMGETLLTSEMVFGDEWGAVVLRVGGEGDLPEPFYNHLTDVTGKSPNGFAFTIPLGA